MTLLDKLLAKLKELGQKPYIQKQWLAFKEFLNNIVESLKSDDLLKADREFWSFHIGGISMILFLDMVINSLSSFESIWGFFSLVYLAWGVGFFYAGLLIRSQYKKAQWEAQPHINVLSKSLFCSLFFSFVIVVLMTILSMTFYFDDFYKFRGNFTPGISSIDVFSEFFFNNWFITFFYLLIWTMLYIGITSRRKTKQIELDNLRLQNSLKEAELSSLSNQLNPHFLFNALNNIRFMIHEDAHNAEKMIMSLSGVLRYSLDSSKNDLVPLIEELDISRSYIDLIQIQFEERLKFSANVSHTLNQCTLPPMVLQMLLENAVKHGIDNIREGGEISINAILKKQVLHIEVTNTLPVDHDTRSSKPIDKDSCIGLINIEQRLSLLYSGQGSLETQIKDNRFIVNLKIPQT